MSTTAKISLPVHYVNDRKISSPMHFNLTKQNYFDRIARVCCYVTITGQLLTSYIPNINITRKYVTQVKPVYGYDTIQKASLNIQTLSKTATYSLNCSNIVHCSTCK